MRKMGLDPADDKRFYKLAVDAFGAPEFEWVGSQAVYEDWVNIGEAACDMLDIGEEFGTISYFFGESMAHVDTTLFP